jgi:hypothetical protein
MENLKMNKLVSKKVDAKAMNVIRGGAESCSAMCICGCQGPSSNSANGNANKSEGKFSPGGGTLYSISDGQ